MVDLKTLAALADAVVPTLQHAAASPATGVTEQDVDPVAAAIVQAVAPVVEHVTNTEPWYQSRVTWGAIIATAAPLLSAVGVATDWLTPDLAVSLSTAAVTLVGGGLTLYGRWRARRPLGRQ